MAWDLELSLWLPAPGGPSEEVAGGRSEPRRWPVGAALISSALLARENPRWWAKRAGALGRLVLVCSPSLKPALYSAGRVPPQGLPLSPRGASDHSPAGLRGCARPRRARGGGDVSRARAPLRHLLAGAPERLQLRGGTVPIDPGSPSACPRFLWLSRRPLFTARASPRNQDRPFRVQCTKPQLLKPSWGPWSRVGAGDRLRAPWVAPSFASLLQFFKSYT